MKSASVVAAIVLLTVSAYASEPAYFSDRTSVVCAGAAKVAGSYLAALSSTNDGVVESALSHVAMVKLAAPACDLTSVLATVAAIEHSGSSTELRYKAFVTRSVLEHPGMFATISTDGYSSPDELFGALASRMGVLYAVQ